MLDRANTLQILRDYKNKILLQGRRIHYYVKTGLLYAGYDDLIQRNIKILRHCSTKIVWSILCLYTFDFRVLYRYPPKKTE